VGREDEDVARYGQGFKDRAVARLLPPESADVQVVAAAVGVSADTLERWRSEALASGKKSGGWTAAARFEAVLATASMSEAQKAAWCREKGLFPSELEDWRKAATQALAQPAERSEPKVERRRIRELERELRRKDKALAEAAALLVLSKKVEALYRRDADE
jgi:transposase